ncbi:Putative competence-damage inducible protein [Microbacterium oxydans]|uniref:CinA family protein n=1 Tax=Microbacterium oxydans TaxID=82380 RepID=UPI001D9138EE|nr:CinA family protein [Microbacterium oxydans]CAH0126062.1 Putative competence-damage inducible protein [Microbacterium oxydans]
MTSSQAAAALDALHLRGWTLGVAESLTGGAVCAELVSVAGASAVLWGGVVAYATPVKESLLGVETDLLARTGPVHPDVALQMADGVRRVVAVDGRPADVGISTTGIAGPDSPDGQPVGTVHVGIVTPDVAVAVELHLEGDRAEIRAASVEAALSALLEVLGNS